jgi:uncharacterized protein involved in type VI secretion and phage assembly
MRRRFYGKYRGVVTDNNDERHLGRIKALVPDVLGKEKSDWATPAVPYAGPQVGFFLIPPQDASVWIEFEHGDPDRPIWTGCFWATTNDVPLSPVTPDKKVIKTAAGTITLDDTQGSTSITIETPNNLKLKMDQQGIEISKGARKIMISSSSVAVNDGALEVT